MISERSCDIEDWKKCLLKIQLWYHRNKLHHEILNKKTVILDTVFYSILDQIKAALVNIKLILKTLQILPNFVKCQIYSLT